MNISDIVAAVVGVKMGGWECKHCRATKGVQHSFNCPRSKACKHCHGDLDKRTKKAGGDYHPWCAIKVKDDFTPGIMP